ncbi:MAG: alpha-glucosidase, partial [Marivirga sp.]
NFWTNEVVTGKKEVEVAAPLNQIPLFVKAGTILPMQPKMQYTDEFIPKEIDLHVYASEHETTSTLYEDDGQTKDYERGFSCIKSLIYTPSANEIKIKQLQNGDYDFGYDHYRIHLKALTKPVHSITVDSEQIIFENIDGIISFMVKKDFDTIIAVL